MDLNKYTNRAYATRFIVLGMDVILSFVSIHLASLLRHNFILENSFSFFAIPVLLVLGVRILTFRWFRTYAVIVRYVGASDVLQVFLTVLGGSVFALGLSVVFKSYGLFLPLSILFIDFFLLLSLMAATRLLMPSIYKFLFLNRDAAKTKVLLIGAGHMGAITRNVIRQDNKSNYNIVAMIDDNPEIRKKSLDGVPVYHPSYISKLVKEENIEKAIFAIKNISSKRKSEIVDLCIDNGLKVLQIPFSADWIRNEFKVNQLKEIQIEDLLNRPVIEMDIASLENEYTAKVVMVTGGAGSIGSELVRQLTKYNPEMIIVVDQAETPIVGLDLELKEDFNFEIKPIIADVNEYKRMEEIFEEYQPEIVFHAAAYKHVPIMESYPREAISVNVLGTKFVADLANRFACEKFIMVSTDKAVNPTNVMGASKRIAEMYIQSLNKVSKTNFITTRFGNVLGSNGSVVPRFKKQIENGGPVTVTHPEITRYFMTIPEASLLVLEAGAMGSGGEIFLFDMGEPVKIANLAEKMILLSGLVPNEDIEIRFTGLRPGEKLIEELLSDLEHDLPTHHPKITRAKVRHVDHDYINKEIMGLLTNMDEESNMDTVQRMKKLVPEYVSNNSKFGVLDGVKTKEDFNPKEIPNQA